MTLYNVACVYAVLGMPDGGDRPARAGHAGGPRRTGRPGCGEEFRHGTAARPPTLRRVVRALGIEPWRPVGLPLPGTGPLASSQTTRMGCQAMRACVIPDEFGQRQGCEPRAGTRADRAGRPDDRPDLSCCRKSGRSRAAPPRSARPRPRRFRRRSLRAAPGSCGAHGVVIHGGSFLERAEGQAVQYHRRLRPRRRTNLPATASCTCSMWSPRMGASTANRRWSGAVVRWSSIWPRAFGSAARSATICVSGSSFDAWRPRCAALDRAGRVHAADRQGSLGGAAARAGDRDPVLRPCGGPGRQLSGWPRHPPELGSQHDRRPLGQDLAQVPESPGFATAKLDLAYLGRVREMLPVHQHRVLPG